MKVKKVSSRDRQVGQYNKETERDIEVHRETEGQTRKIETLKEIETESGTPNDRQRGKKGHRIRK